MRKQRTIIRKAGTLLLSVWLCIALMPVGAFAEAADPAQEPQDVVLETEPQGDVLTDDELQPEDVQTDDELQPEDVQEESPVEEQIIEEQIYTKDALNDATCQHDFVFVPLEDATCQHIGWKAHMECSLCSVWADTNGKVLADTQDLMIPVKNHKWDKGKEIRKPTASKNGITRYTCTVCGATMDKETYYKAPVKTAKSFKLDGNQLQFKSNVATSSPAFLKNARIEKTSVKAAKNKMTVSWTNAKNMKAVDGVIILRKTGTQKVYKEIKRLTFKTTSNNITRWNPKTSYADTTAKKKNTPYTYIVVSFLKQDGVVYISHCSDWSAGQTTASKLKSVYKATINKKSASLQVKGKVKLTLKYKTPKKTYASKSFRWYSDNPAVAKVSSKGVVTAVKPGTTTIRGRLASGNDIKCTVKVVGAFKPAAPKLRVDIATNSSVTLVWNGVKHATSYDLYRSDDGLHWKKPVRVNGTTKKVTGLTKGHRYTFYVIARNDNSGYTALSNNSNVLYQKAVIKRRLSTLTGFPTSKSLQSGKTFSVTVKISSPDGRKAKLQKHEGKKWVTKKTITLPKGAGVKSVKITFPNSWWGETSSWRLDIPHSATSEAVTSKTLKITSKRRYQNPSKYVQISDSISKHGYGYYTSPVLVNSNSTKSAHIEALIKTAGKYKGDHYVNGKSGAPGKGIDASGLVIQACYGAGVDLWPISPATRPSNCVPRIKSSRLRSITYKSVEGSTDHPGVMRGDLIFFYTGNNVLGHVAIYLGWDKIIHASMVTGKVETSTISELTLPVNEGGRYGYKVAAVRRIFN